MSENELDLTKAVPDVNPEMEPSHLPDPAVLAEAKAALRARSFSQRNPHLGKMINCPICNTRHRDKERICVPKFSTTKRGPDGEQIECKERSLERMVKDGEIKEGIKNVLGAHFVAKRRFKPHPNKRKLQFIEAVRAQLPDEYTKEELQAARKRAARVLSRAWGRYGFLPPIWQVTKHECTEDCKHVL